MAEFIPNEAQKKAIETSGANILVSAAAGSGKTTVLVERVLKMVIRDKVNIDSLIIVTFTKAAADSMKSKIYSRIRKAIKEENPDNETKEHLRKQLMKIHSAKICTIDSLCLDIVKENFQYIDLDPGFRIADEGELSMLKADVLSQMLEDHYGNPDDSFLEFVSYYTDKNDSKIEVLINQLLNFAESHPEPENFLKKAVASYVDADNLDFDWEKPENKWIDLYAKLVNETIISAYNMCQKGKGICNANYGPYKYLENFELVEPLLVSTLSAPCDDRRYRIEDILKTWKPLSRKKAEDIDENLKKKAQDLYGEIKKTLEKLIEKYMYSDLESMYKDMGSCINVAKELVDLVLEYRERLNEAKREKNIASFNDVAHFAINVLINYDEDGNAIYTEVADNYAKAAKEIIVDEYQDTNRLQDELIKALSAERFGRPNIFMVGDVKQSIYGFRMACPELFLEKYNTYEDLDNCERIILGENYRSRKEILDFTNFIFGQVMIPSVGGIDYTNNNELIVGRGIDENEIIPEVILINESGNTGKIAEGYVIAEKIEELVTSGEYDYKDIVILSRNASNPQIEKVLSDRNIPVIKSSSVGFFDALEIRLCLNILRIIDNPYQDIDFTAVITSPLLGLDANQLAEIKAKYSGEKFSIYEGLKEYADCDEKCKEFLDRYEQWRDTSCYLGISQFIDYLLDDSGLLYIASAMPSGESRRANLDFLKSLSVDFSNGSYTGLFNFIRYIEELTKNNMDFGQAQVVNKDFNAVSMMTIHKSKGLEFPVVFLARTGKEYNTEDLKGPVVLDDDLGIGIEVRDVENKIKRHTLLMETIIEKKKRDSYAEEIRLLYVALTRAKEKLIITGSGAIPKTKLDEWESSKEYPVRASVLDADEILSDNGFMRLLGDCMVNLGDAAFTWNIKNIEDIETERVVEIIETEKSKEYLEGICACSAEHDPAANEIFSYVYPFKDAASTLLKKTASQLEEYSFDEESYARFKAFNVGSERGTAYHKLFELLDYDNRDVQGQLDKITLDGFLTKEEEKLIKIQDFEKFLGSEIGKRMKEAYDRGKLKREQQFVMGITENGELRLIQGIIDAFFEENDGFVLVDYKTDRNKTEEELVRTYRKQQEAYSRAIEAATGKKVKEMILYSTDLGKEIVII